MAKTSSPARRTSSDDQLATAVRESAEQIWLAGLGAFAKAQEEGTKVFEALVREGDILQQRTRAVTEQRLEQVADRFTEAATQLSRQATQSWDRLEQVFEDRVARALSHLGVPSARDVKELTEMLQALNQRISDLDVVPAGRAGAPAAKAARATRSRGSRKVIAGASPGSTAPAPRAAAAPRRSRAKA
jgi:poly(hydroxyalkanoate) granule-associated protein